jgi:hypothetical protein
MSMETTHEMTINSTRLWEWEKDMAALQVLFKAIQLQVLVINVVQALA